MRVILYNALCLDFDFILRLKHSIHAMRKVDAGTYSNTCKFMHQFAQSKFLHASCSCCDLRPMLSNRHPHPLRAAARRLYFSLYWDLFKKFFLVIEGYTNIIKLEMLIFIVLYAVLTTEPFSSIIYISHKTLTLCVVCVSKY